MNTIQRIAPTRQRGDSPGRQLELFAPYNPAKDLCARIRLVVPEVAPYPLPPDEPAVSPAFFARDFRTLEGSAATPTIVDIRFGRERPGRDSSSERSRIRRGDRRARLLEMNLTANRPPAKVRPLGGAV